MELQDGRGHLNPAERQLLGEQTDYPIAPSMVPRFVALTKVRQPAADEAGARVLDNLMADLDALRGEATGGQLNA